MSDILPVEPNNPFYELIISGSTLIVGILLILIRKYKDIILDYFRNTEFDPHVLKKDAAAAIAIKQHMSELRAVTGASRVSIFFLHNGEICPENIHFKKMSCKFEVCDHMIKEEKNECQSLDILEFPDLLEKIADADDVDTVCVSKLSEEYSTKQFFAARGEECSIFKIIKFPQMGKLYIWGFILLSFCSKQCQADNTDIGQCQSAKHFGVLTRYTNIIIPNLKKLGSTSSKKTWTSWRFWK